MRRRGLSRGAIGAALTALALILLPACGGSSGGESRPKPNPKASRPVRAPSGPRVGRTLRVKTRDTTLAVTVRRVIDPLRRSGAAVDPGSRAIGVLVKVRNRGSGTYDGSSQSDFSVTSRGREAAIQAYAPKGRCMTPEVDFLRQFGPGRSGSGCVVFGLTKGEQVARVTFSPREKRGRSVSWVVR